MKFSEGIDFFSKGGGGGGGTPGAGARPVEGAPSKHLASFMAKKMGTTKA